MSEARRRDRADMGRSMLRPYEANPLCKQA